MKCILILQFVQNVLDGGTITFWCQSSRQEILVITWEYKIP